MECAMIALAKNTIKTIRLHFSHFKSPKTMPQLSNYDFPLDKKSTGHSCVSYLNQLHSFSQE